MKLRGRKSTRANDSSKKQKTDQTICSNKFSILSIKEPLESLQMDDCPPLPAAHTQQPPAKNPKKKPKPGKTQATQSSILDLPTALRTIQILLHVPPPSLNLPKVICGTVDFQLNLSSTHHYR
ncbi:hypothetical protein NPIL_174241 [Nephila pilipes]|uniref:Uncharacterized protein n=1 Tax=Nephila pilipes TaxID=299642 RepID=A0A8X6TGI8_NEPPI|nr:hypothetical protein NPIL_174241 [Nephila pilipes]